MPYTTVYSELSLSILIDDVIGQVWTWAKDSAASPYITTYWWFKSAIENKLTHDLKAFHDDCSLYKEWTMDSNPLLDGCIYRLYSRLSTNLIVLLFCISFLLDVCGVFFTVDPQININDHRAVCENPAANEYEKCYSFWELWCDVITGTSDLNSNLCHWSTM